MLRLDRYMIKRKNGCIVHPKRRFFLKMSVFFFIHWKSKFVIIFSFVFWWVKKVIQFCYRNKRKIMMCCVKGNDILSCPVGWDFQWGIMGELPLWWSLEHQSEDLKDRWDQMQVNKRHWKSALKIFTILFFYWS